MSYAEAEMEIIEMCHADVGGLLAQHWQLPESTVQAIVFHHNPGRMPATISYVVHLANAVSKTAEKKEEAALIVDRASGKS